MSKKKKKKKRRAVDTNINAYSSDALCNFRTNSHADAHLDVKNIFIMKK